MQVEAHFHIRRSLLSRDCCRNTASGALYATGDNSFGQLGVGNDDTGPRTTFTAVHGIKDAVSVSTGAKHSLACTGAYTRGSHVQLRPHALTPCCPWPQLVARCSLGAILDGTARQKIMARAGS